MKMMGMDLRRDLPSYATKTWTKSIKKLNTKTTDPDVILLVDTYTQCHHPQSGIAAVNVLEKLGQKVMLLDAGCCQRPRISHGFLKDAAQKVKPGIQKILPWLEKNIPMGVLEPGCASAWTDDIPDLIEDDRAARLLKQIVPFEKILLQVLSQSETAIQKIRPRSSEIMVHGHCHQKSMYGMDTVKSIFAMWPDVKYTEIDSGCCGMAGSFGYEARHYEVSKKMAERVLIPAIEDHPDAMVVANGFSCRHQIADFAGREAIHIAQAFDID